MERVCRVVLFLICIATCYAYTPPLLLANQLVGVSQNGQYASSLQNDGNLCVNGASGYNYCSGSQGDNIATLYGDGNLCVGSKVEQNPYGTLLHYWPGDIDFGDKVGMADGSVHGGVSLTTTNAYCGSGFLLSRSGSVNFGNLPAFENGDYTFSFYVTRLVTPYVAVFSKRASCDFGDFWSFYIDSTGLFYYEIDIGGLTVNSVSVRSSTIFAINTTYHVAVTRVGFLLNMYVNGALQDTEVIPDYNTAFFVSNTPAILGYEPCINNATSELTVIVDEIQIFGGYVPITSLYHVPCSLKLIHYWPLDADFGDKTLVGSAANGVNNGGIFTNPTSPARCNAGVLFRKDTYASLGNVQQFENNDFTISFWFNMLYTNPSGNVALLSRRTGCAGGTFWSFRIMIASNGSPYVFFEFESTGYISVSSNTVTSVLNHISAVKQGSTFYLFLNGQQQSVPQTANFAAFTSSVAVLLGSDPCTGTTPALNTAILDEVQIYSQAILTPGVLYNAPCPSPLIHSWPGDVDFEDKVGQNNGVNSGVTFSPVSLAERNAGFSITRNSSVNLGNIPQFENSDFTISLWVRMLVTGTVAIVSRRVACGAEVFWNIRTEGANLKFEFCYTNPCYSLLAPFAVSNASMHHIAATRQGSKLSLYIDGVSSAPTATISPSTLVFTTSTNVKLGWNPCIGALTGETTLIVDELKIYRQAVPIAFLYNYPTVEVGKGLDPIHRWSFDGSLIDKTNYPHPAHGISAPSQYSFSPANCYLGLNTGAVGGVQLGSTTPPPQLFENSDFAIGFWVTMNLILPDSTLNLLKRRDSDCGNSWWAFRSETTTLIFEFQIIDYAVFQLKTNWTFNPTNNTHHVAVTRQGLVFTLYLDGQSKASYTLSLVGTPVAFRSYTFFSVNNGDSCSRAGANGLAVIDDIRIYNQFFLPTLMMTAVCDADWCTQSSNMALSSFSYTFQLSNYGSLQILQTDLSSAVTVFWSSPKDYRGLQSRFAPILKFHSRELYWPTNIEYFLSNGASLYITGSSSQISTPTSPYKSWLVTQMSYLSLFGFNNADNAYLDVDEIEESYVPNWLTATKPTTPSQMTQYVVINEYNDSIDITYWQYYPWHDVKTTLSVQNHVSDWTHARVTLRKRSLNDYFIYAVMLNNHGNKWIYNAQNSNGLTMRGEQPVVYVALGTHELYALAIEIVTTERYNTEWMSDETNDSGQEINTATSVAEIYFYGTGTNDFITVDSTKYDNSLWLEYLGRWGNRAGYPLIMGNYGGDWLTDGPVGPNRPEEYHGTPDQLQVTNTFSTILHADYMPATGVTPTLPAFSVAQYDSVLYTSVVNPTTILPSISGGWLSSDSGVSTVFYNNKVYIFVNNGGAINSYTTTDGINFAATNAGTSLTGCSGTAIATVHATQNQIHITCFASANIYHAVLGGSPAYWLSGFTQYQTSTYPSITYFLGKLWIFYTDVSDGALSYITSPTGYAWGNSTKMPLATATSCGPLFKSTYTTGTVVFNNRMYLFWKPSTYQRWTDTCRTDQVRYISTTDGVNWTDPPTYDSRDQYTNSFLTCNTDFSVTTDGTTLYVTCGYKGYAVVQTYVPY